MTRAECVALGVMLGALVYPGVLFVGALITRRGVLYPR